MKPKRTPALVLALALLSPFIPSTASACTSILVSRGASVDGATMITYAADSHVLYGELYHYPAATYPAGASREIIDWDSGKRLGSIPEVRRTFSVVGNINEHQLAISETTFGGRKELKDPEGGVDYGSLMYIALQRARTAREAIKVITSLVALHGYASSGESLSIADPKEAWILEIIGKGPKNKGAVWVARRVPDGYISAHANQARIRTFPRNNKRDCLYAEDVVSFARAKGYYTGPDKDFSFADAYAPMKFRDFRVRQARVWSIYRRVAPGRDFKVDFLKGTGRLPLWVKPKKKLGVRDVMELMRDHFQGTPLDMTRGVGAGPYQLPYRWRPLTWTLDGKAYLNERAISTQQTGFSFVSQSRARLPGPVGGVLWFGVDDTYSTVYVPMYAGITRIPRAFAVGTADFKTFSWDAAFWVFNWVSNWAYTRYSDMIQDIRRVQQELEGGFLSRQAEVEGAAMELYKRSPGLARDYLTRYVERQSARTVGRWRRLGQELFIKYMDGNVRDSQGKVTHPSYRDAWLRRIVKERPAQFRQGKMPGEEQDPPAPKKAPGSH